MRHLNKIRETNGGKIKKQDVPLTSIGFMSFLEVVSLILSFLRNADIETIKDETS